MSHLTMYPGRDAAALRRRRLLFAALAVAGAAALAWLLTRDRPGFVPVLIAMGLVMPLVHDLTQGWWLRTNQERRTR